MNDTTVRTVTTYWVELDWDTVKVGDRVRAVSPDAEEYVGSVQTVGVSGFDGARYLRVLDANLSPERGYEFWEEVIVP